MFGRVNVDDYDLKISRILRHSQYKRQILTLPLGSFVYVPNDSIVNFPKFQQKGKPYEITLEQEPKPEMPRSIRIMQRIGNFLTALSGEQNEGMVFQW